MKQEKKERSKEIPENRDWHAIVVAAKAGKHPLYWIETITGQTVDVTLSLAQAQRYVRNTGHCANQFKIYKRDPLGHMILCHSK